MAPGAAAPVLADLIRDVRVALARLDRGLVQTWFAHVAESDRGPR